MNVQTIGPKSLDAATAEVAIALTRSDSGRPDAVEVEVTASADAGERPPAAGTLETALNQAGAAKMPPVRFLVEGKGYRQSSSVFVVRTAVA